MTLLAQLEAIGDKSLRVSEEAVSGLILPLRTLLRDAMYEVLRKARTICTAEVFQQAFGVEESLLEGMSTSMFKVILSFLEDEDVSTLQKVLRSATQVVAVLSEVIKEREDTEGRNVGSTTQLYITAYKSF